MADTLTVNQAIHVARLVRLARVTIESGSSPMLDTSAGRGEVDLAVAAMERQCEAAFRAHGCRFDLTRPGCPTFADLAGVDPLEALPPC